MCPKVAFKTSKSRRQSAGLREIVPESLTGNRKGSVSELGSCPWNSEVVVVPGRYWQTQRILSGILRGSDCRDL